MKLLLDTHLLIWAAEGDRRLSATAVEMIEEPDSTLHLSVVSLWEVSIKAALGRRDFQVDARLLRRACLANGYIELSVSGEHALAVGRLPTLHRDPFDRMLLAQAQVEGMTLLTSDAALAAYPGPIVKV